MFCEEEIFGVYYGIGADGGSGSFFDCYHEKGTVTFFTFGERMILETKTHYIALGALGTELLEKTKPVRMIALPGEIVSSTVAEVTGMGTEYGIENVLFTGERLLEERAADSGRECVFDHFTLRIVPCPCREAVPVFSVPREKGILPVYGCEGLIERRCACGGTGEMTADGNREWSVRCPLCGRATEPRPFVFYAAAEWNRGNTGGMA